MRALRYLTPLLLCLVNSARAEVAQYWVYRSTNLLVAAQVEETTQLLKRAGAAGYTHCLLSDSKFCRLGEMNETYFRHVEKVKAAAAAAHVELVPTVFPVGYSNDLLSQDPNLAEGLPVKSCAMTVRHGVAVVDADPNVVIKGGNFTDAMKGWGWKDDTIYLENGTATSRNPAGKNSRISQQLTLQPWRQYHLSVKIKSKNYQGHPEVKFISESGRTLNYDDLKVLPTQDWTVHHVVFNTLEHSKVNLYLGCWDGSTGELSWDDAQLEECPFVNLVRRPQAPLIVTTTDGRPLKEGTDFQPLADPLLGTKPYAGCYSVHHEPPVLRTSLPDGTRLHVSYFHAMCVHDGQVNICVSEPKALETLRDQAQRVHALFHAKSYFMAHDEIRVFNWSVLPNGKQATAGQLLAENVRACSQILRTVNPGGKIYVWGDMFDPNHNARADYYLANGTFADSWLGLDKDIILVPWDYEVRAKSLAFHAGRGHHQLMAGYYDDAKQLNARGWLEAASAVPNVDGIMFTTWQNDYQQLEKFIKQAKGKIGE